MYFFLQIDKMMDLCTASGASDTSAKLAATSPDDVKAPLDFPENGKVSSKNSSVKSFNIDGLIGDQNNSDEPQHKRRRTSTSTTDSNGSRHSDEDEDEDIDVQSDDNTEPDEKSAASLLSNGTSDTFDLLKGGGNSDLFIKKRTSLPSHVQSESSGTVISGAHPSLANLANSNPFAAAAAAAAAAVSGFSPSSNLLTPFMQNAALGKFFGKLTP